MYLCGRKEPDIIELAGSRHNISKQTTTMTKEEFDRQRKNLSMDFRWEEAIRLCRNYVMECRQSGDIYDLAEELYSLYSELSLHGSEEDAMTVFDELFALREALATSDLRPPTSSDLLAYALMLHRKACTTDDIAEAVACQEKAIGIYKELGLYDSRGFDICYDDAFGFLGKLYCYKGDYASGIRYTTIALERALRDGDSDFNIGLYNRRLGIAHLLTGDPLKARECIQTALECFERSNEEDPDPYTYPEVADSCRQLLSECGGIPHPDDYYWKWLI